MTNKVIDASRAIEILRNLERICRTSSGASEFSPDQQTSATLYNIARICSQAIDEFSKESIVEKSLDLVPEPFEIDLPSGEAVKVKPFTAEDKKELQSIKAKLEELKQHCKEEAFEANLAAGKKAEQDLMYDVMNQIKAVANKEGKPVTDYELVRVDNQLHMKLKDPGLSVGCKISEERDFLEDIGDIQLYVTEYPMSKDTPIVISDGKQSLTRSKLCDEHLEGDGGGTVDTANHAVSFAFYKPRLYNVLITYADPEGGKHEETIDPLGKKNLTRINAIVDGSEDYEPEIGDDAVELLEPQSSDVDDQEQVKAQYSEAYRRLRNAKSQDVTDKGDGYD